MRFHVIDVEQTQEQETDYDTAVDMTNATIDHRRVILRSEAGASILVDHERMNVWSSSLEPNLDDDPTEPGPVGYHAVPGEKGKITNDYRVSARYPLPLPRLDENDWAALERVNEHVAAHGYVSNYATLGIDGEQGDRLTAYLEHEACVHPFSREAWSPERGPGLFTPQVAQAWSQATAKVAPGQTVDLPVSAPMAVQLHELAQAQARTFQDNRDNAMRGSIARNARQARLELSQHVQAAQTSARRPRP